MSFEYFKIEVRLRRHPKVLELEDAGPSADKARHLYQDSIGYANEQTTDGFISPAVARELARDPDPHGLGWTLQQHCDALVKVHLWHRVEGGAVVDPCNHARCQAPPDAGPVGWLIHDYVDHNTLKAQRLAKQAERDADRESERLRKAKQRARAAGPASGGERPNGVPPGQPRLSHRDNPGTPADVPLDSDGTPPDVPRDNTALSVDHPASGDVDRSAPPVLAGDDPSHPAAQPATSSPATGAAAAQEPPNAQVSSGVVSQRDNGGTTAGHRRDVPRLSGPLARATTATAAQVATAASTAEELVPPSAGREELATRADPQPPIPGPPVLAVVQGGKASKPSAKRAGSEDLDQDGNAQQVIAAYVRASPGPVARDVRNLLGRKAKELLERDAFDLATVVEAAELLVERNLDVTMLPRVAQQVANTNAAAAKVWICPPPGAARALAARKAETAEKADRCKQHGNPRHQCAPCFQMGRVDAQRRVAEGRTRAMVEQIKAELDGRTSPVDVAGESGAVGDPPPDVGEVVGEAGGC